VIVQTLKCIISGIPTASLKIQHSATIIANSTLVAPFAQTVNGTKSAISVFYIENVGNAVLYIQSIEVINETIDFVCTCADASDFIITAIPAGPVRAGSGVWLDILFQPSGIGERNAAIKILYEDLGSGNNGEVIFAIQGNSGL
jgi:hypothetical protein